VSNVETVVGLATILGVLIAAADFWRRWFGMPPGKE
jgi:hypothetical protein